MSRNNFPHYRQLDAMDCGATCLRMIAKYYGRLYTAQTLRQRSSITREGVSLLGISDAAESIGMRTMGVKTTLENLEKEKLPHLLHIGIKIILLLFIKSIKLMFILLTRVLQKLLTVNKNL
jgi:ATP-binding cassette subfamily B protein